ncbi:hypothetical protein C8R43DRAFT_1102140 [Mycena crocata]|nr:hypothetical protein C8R43DRAFT_1102140 [Mycena crocata]
MSPPFASKLGTNYCPLTTSNPPADLTPLNEETAIPQMAIDIELKDERNNIGAYLGIRPMLNYLRRLACLVARRRAFASGSSPAVYAMYSILELCHREGLVHLALEQMRRQFEIEYGLSLAPNLITSGIQFFASPTKPEMDGKFSYLLQRGALEHPAE